MARLLFIILILLPGLTLAQSPMEKAVVMPLKDVRPGMRGKIYTVFQGSNIESFNAEVVGILDNFIGPGIDLILCKLPDAKTWSSGAGAGMSGSPLYIDGRMVGALAYGLQIFETERYCGVTPIEPMLDVFKYEPVSANAANRTTRIKLASGKTADFSGLQKLVIPLAIAGAPARVIDLYAPAWRKLGLEPAQAGGGGSIEKRIEAPFIPGAAVAGVLVRGDLNIAGTGTLTWRDGNRVVGFGHPFLDIGTIAMPMAQAEIVTILPSLFRSFKVSNVRQNIGTITQDRLTAIGGIIGPSPETIPVSITTTDPQSGKKTYRYEVTRIDQITPLVLSMVSASSLMQTLDYSDHFTIQATGKASFEGAPDLVFDDTYSGEGSDRLMIVFDTGYKIAGVLTNPHEKARLKSVDLEWNLVPERKSWALEAISVSKQIISPGETIMLSYTVRPWRGKSLTRQVAVKIPEEVKEGELELRLSDAAAVNNQFFFIPFFMMMNDSHLSVEEKLARSIQPVELFARGENPVTTRQLIDVFNKQVPQNAYYLRLMQSAPGVVVEDKVSENLPASIVSVYQDSKINQPVGIINQVELLRVPLKEDGVALGSKSVRLKVVNRP